MRLLYIRQQQEVHLSDFIRILVGILGFGGGHP